MKTESKDLVKEYFESLKSLKLSRIQEVLYNIFCINADLQANWIMIEQQLHDVENRYLIHTIHYYCLIQVCSFLEEYKLLEAQSRTDEKLRRSLYILSPGIRRVRKYKGLQNIRNSMLAHYNRNKTSSFVPYWKVIEEVKYPKTENDINLLLELIIGIGNKLHERHIYNLQPAILKMKQEKMESFQRSFALENFIETKEDYLMEKKKIIREMVDREMELYKKQLEELEKK